MILFLMLYVVITALDGDLNGFGWGILFLLCHFYKDNYRELKIGQGLLKEWLKRN